MSLGSEAFMVGQYAVTYNAIALGLMEGEEGVPTLIQRLLSKKINSSDKWGDMLIDAIRRGVDFQLKMVCLEALKASGAIWPFGSTQGLLVSPLGTLHTALAKTLVMTALAGTPAATSPATRTATKALLASDHVAEIQFGPMVRAVPLVFDLFPYDTGAGVMGHFVDT